MNVVPSLNTAQSEGLRARYYANLTSSSHTLFAELKKKERRKKKRQDKEMHSS